MLDPVLTSRSIKFLLLMNITGRLTLERLISLPVWSSMAYSWSSYQWPEDSKSSSGCYLNSGSLTLTHVIKCER